MRVIGMAAFGPPDVLQIVDEPKPQVQPGEVVIRVEAAGVSRADVLQRQGKYPPPPGASNILGLDVAGTIEEIGPGVDGWQRGDKVCALVNGGGYAEFCRVPATQVLPIPEGWSAVEAVTLPENLFTVYDNVATRAQLSEGETLLVHGGTSGIGSTVIMLARALKAIPYATAGSDAKCRAAVEIGAAEAINYKSRDFVSEIQRITSGRGVDVIADIVGGSYLERNLQCLALEGRLSIIATLGGANATLEIGRLMARRGTIIGSTMRPRTAEEKGTIARRLRDNIWPLLPAKTTIRPIVDSVFPFRSAAAAHARLEEGGNIGKIVLQP